MPLPPLLALNYDFSLVLPPDGIGQGFASRERSGRPAAGSYSFEATGWMWLFENVGTVRAGGGEGFSFALLPAGAPRLPERSRRVGLPGKCWVEGYGREEAGPGPGKSDRRGAASFALAERLGSHRAKV